MIGFYDNVHLMMWGCHEVSPHLENVNRIVSPHGEVIGVVGGYGGLKVRVYDNRILIDGSFAKYLHDGSNTELLDTQSMQEAIVKISDGLHVDISQAKVRSVEFGTQFSMVEPVGAYLCRLGELSRYYRSTVSRGSLESVYYAPISPKRKQPTKKKNKPRLSKTLIFYDKGQEARSKGMKLPDGCNHLLKYELRLKWVLKKIFKGTPCTIDLCNRDNYRQFAKLWHDEYFKINKQKMATMSNITELTAKQLFEQFSGEAILGMGNEFKISFLEDVKARGVDNVTMSRLRKYINKATSNSIPDELIKELDDCVDNAIAFV